MASFANAFTKTKRNKIVGELRKSKISSTQGCGSLVELPGFSGVIGGQNLWQIGGNINNLKIHDKSLEELLEKEYFLQAASDYIEGRRGEKAFSIPIIRFPEYYYCPKCHKLDKVERLAKNLTADRSHVESLICANCGDTELIASRFITVCEDGHLDDFPYDYWVHGHEKCGNSKLKLKFVGETSGLESIVVSCESCGKQRTMANVLNKDATIGLKCFGKRPWLGKNDRCDCNKPIRVLLRGASNLYFPERVGALTIPPWSNRIQRVIDNNFESLQPLFAIDLPEDMMRPSLIKIIGDKGWNILADCSIEDFVDQVMMRFNESEKDVTEKTIELDEYKALTGMPIDDTYFKIEEAKVADELQSVIKQVKLVKRLREVQVLTSFRRISGYSEEGGKPIPLSNKPEKWLPATELLGEGVFIEFSREAINQWLSTSAERYEKMQQRFLTKRMANRLGSFSPTKVLLHTFSHLLLREMSNDCGYDTASICEKIYVSDENDDEWMSGILIYTAATCSDGSLGGLVRLGQTDSLKNLVLSMLDRAMWCSNDPICIESNSQGLYSMNYAACHACLLAPETSCKYNNLLLDRVAVIGKPEDRELGILGYLL